MATSQLDNHILCVCNYALCIVYHSIFSIEQTPCPSLPEFNHGSVSFVNDPNWDELCRVTFTCNPGYTMTNGSNNIFCFYGQWVGEIPTCIGKL